MDTPEEADGYDAMDHSLPNEAFIERLVELGAQGEMLDVGTGPGHIPLLACARIDKSSVLGIDLASHMLAHAEKHRALSPYRHRVTYRLADAKGLPFEDASFDAVYSNTILHHIPDPQPFLREARRVLRRGGVLLIRDLIRPENEVRVLELVHEHAGSAAPYQQALFRASLCAAFTPTEFRDLAHACGLANAAIIIDSDRHMSLQIAATNRP
jgi:ubiquinone/menaquinone biosynthesis C-methylase UbiE